jgi:O-antigen/teichoic acid export membrane protein
VGRIAVTFLSQLVLARTLGPEVFGVFGYAFLTVSLLALVVDMGLQSALVQVAKLDPGLIAAACGRLMTAGIVGSLGVFVFADAIAAGVFGAPQAAPVLKAMAPTLFVGAVSVAATALLTRELDFRSVQLASLLSYLVGYLGVGVATALAGFGVWSLVLAWHTQTVMACAILMARSPHSLRPSNPLRRLPIDRYAGTVMGSHVASWAIDNGPHAAVGRWMGASMLGLFSVAYNLVRVPSDHLVRNIQSVLHSLVSRAQDNEAGMRRAYLTATAGIGLIAFPLFGFVATLAEPIVDLLLGQRWLAAASVLTPLSLVMAMHAVEGMAGPTLGGRGEPGVELRIKLVMLALTVPVLIVTSRWSLPAVGWGLALVVVVRWLLMNSAVLRRLHIPPAQFLRAIAGPLVLLALACAVPSAVKAGLSAAEIQLPSAWIVVTCTMATAAIMVALTAGLPQIVLGPHLLSLVSGLFENRPWWAANVVTRRLAASAAQAARDPGWAQRGASAG